MYSTSCPARVTGFPQVLCITRSCFTRCQRSDGRRGLPRQRHGAALVGTASRWRSAVAGGRGSCTHGCARTPGCAAVNGPADTPPRRGLRGVQPTAGSRTSGRNCAPVSTAARGPVSAAADTPSPPDYPRLTLGCQATFRPPIGAATRSHSRCALPYLIAPRGAHKEGTGAAALFPCHWFLSPPIPLMRGAADRSRS
jgi:hypothetical protein